MPARTTVANVVPVEIVSPGSCCAWRRRANERPALRPERPRRRGHRGLEWHRTGDRGRAGARGRRRRRACRWKRRPPRSRPWPPTAAARSCWSATRPRRPTSNGWQAPPPRRSDAWTSGSTTRPACWCEPFLETTVDDWHDLLGANLFGYVWGCRAAAPPHGRPRRRTHRQRQLGRRRAAAGRSVRLHHGEGRHRRADEDAGRRAGAARDHGQCHRAGRHRHAAQRVSYTPEVRAAYEKRISLGRIATPEESATRRCSWLRTPPAT